MKDFRTLKILDRFRGLFERFGIDYPVMRKILAVKLTMDGRGTPTVFNQQKKKQKPEENGFIKSLGMYVLISIVLIPIVNFGQNYLYQMSIFFGVVMFLVMTSMISDFSNVLLDVKDKSILHTKPIEKRTINAAKTVHICLYLFFLTMAIAGIPVVIGTVTHGLIFLIFSIFGLMFINLFIVVFTALIYNFILRFFDGEKLKDVINYVQIGLSIAVMVGYQLLGRAFSFVDMKITFSPSWWHFFIPPIWFGAPFALYFGHQSNKFLWLYFLLAFLIPVISIMIYIRMIPSFERNLQKLSNHSRKSKPRERRWKNWLMHTICRSREEKVFFRFADHMMRNEREFRLKVYPSLGMSLVIPFIFIFNQIHMTSFADMVSTKWYLAIYFSSLMIPTAVSMMKYSGKYKGAWIYKTAPVENYAPLFSAVLKVFIVDLYLPVFLIQSVIFVFIFGFKIVLDLLVVFVASILYMVICSRFLKGSLPFSESFENARQSAGVKLIPALILAGVFWGIHFAVTFIPYRVFSYLILLLGITIFSWKMVYRMVWGDS
ncbi:hypothetical protein [Neobacillus fumarioli]|uniref:hypothetical protein n=1 Tax=Neobacillus fumarioli TaxID=105229 RepID=UPI00082A2184|nr:hypothetical protein [Neobacillus fumarioli]